MTNYPLLKSDPELLSAIEREQERQELEIELIASENYASAAVLQAQGTILTNKYAEGYPGKRYYGGCQWVDQVETLAIERAKKLFGVTFANVQPHSGSQANFAVLMALAKPGDTILGLRLDHGGHLTHGSPVNASGQVFHAASYCLSDTGWLDYDAILEQAKRIKPKVLIAGYSAYSRVIDWAKMREIADQVGAYLLADIAHIAGLIVAGEYPSPVNYAHVMTSTTHKTLRGPRGGLILANGSCDAILTKKLNSVIFPGTQGGPLMHVIAAKAVAFQEALMPEFKTYQKRVIRNAQILAEYLQKQGFHIVSGGTDTHLFLLDLQSVGLTGKFAETILESVGITTNKNTIPNDPASPFVTSGLRLGTAAITTRGFMEPEILQIGDWITRVLKNPGLFESELSKAS